jgi:hypothetical protein
MALIKSLEYLDFGKEDFMTVYLDAITVEKCVSGSMVRVINTDIINEWIVFLDAFLNSSKSTKNTCNRVFLSSLLVVEKMLVDLGILEDPLLPGGTRTFKSFMAEKPILASWHNGGEVISIFSDI